MPKLPGRKTTFKTYKPEDLLIHYWDTHAGKFRCVVCGELFEGWGAARAVLEFDPTGKEEYGPEVGHVCGPCQARIISPGAHEGGLEEFAPPNPQNDPPEQVLSPEQQEHAKERAKRRRDKGVSTSSRSGGSSIPACVCAEIEAGEVGGTCPRHTTHGIDLPPLEWWREPQDPNLKPGDPGYTLAGDMSREYPPMAGDEDE